MNKLDNKVIIDREVLQYLINQVSIYEKYHEALDLDEFPFFQRSKQALAADLTGWVAVPHVLTGGMFNASRVDLPETVMLPVGLVAQCKWASILDASPPLPGGGE